jgi:ribosomal protein L35
MHHKPGRRHLLAGKSGKHMRHLRKQAGIGSAAEERKIKSLIPYA